MTEPSNPPGEPIGFPLDRWQPCLPPPRTAMVGHYCRLEPLVPNAHAIELYEAYAQASDPRDWTYLPYGPFPDFQSYQEWLTAVSAQDDPLFYAIVDGNTAKAGGVASFLRIQPSVGVIEVGHIHYAPRLQRTAAATEAMYLMMRRAFDELGYRRYEWKCDALNQRSRKAAIRLGFSFEGIFRQATIYKGRNRDTAWYSIIDREWPPLKQAYLKWLKTSNFDADGRQKISLATLISQARADHPG